MSQKLHEFPTEPGIPVNEPFLRGLAAEIRNTIGL